MEHESKLIVRHYECDGYGHVNNANYLNYLEYARGEFLKAIGFDYKGFMKAGYGIYVVKISINYKSPAFPEDDLTIISKTIERKRATGIFYQKILRGETLLADAEVTWASIGTNGRLAPIPGEWDVPGLHLENNEKNNNSN